MPPLHEIAHLAHVELRTDNPEESLDFFVRCLGLTENGSSGDSVFRRAWDDYENTTIKLTAASGGGGRPVVHDDVDVQARVDALV